MKSSMTVMRKVLVKSIVTDELKRQLKMQMDNAMRNVTEILKNAEKQRKDITRPGTAGPAEQQALYSIDTEIGKLKRQLEELRQKQDEYAELKMGSEFMQGVVDSPCEMNVGDSFFERLSQAEIVLKDGEVVEIKNI
ncbi:MAG: YlqD family protein [Candidatus Wallbacteria bacterium]|nr:YlqD family protein [Candidatus Wallbacteria bacterium]